MAEPTYNTPTVIAPSVPPVTPQAVYSPENMAQTVTNPMAKPDLSDPFGTYKFYMNSPEIQAAKANAQSVMEAINASRQGLRTTTTALQNQNENAQGGTGASINLIGRQVGRARELTSNELSALSENQMAAQSYLDTLTQDAQVQYGIAEQQRAQVQDLIRQTGGKAGISYADNYESAVKKADSYIKKQEKEAKKEAYKDSLKQQLIALGKNTKGLSTKDLEKKLKKYNKNALAEAKKQADAEWQMKVAQFNKSMAGGSGSGVSALNSLLEKAAQMPSGGREWAASVARTYGVNPADVATATAQNGWEGAYRTTTAAQQNAEIARQVEQDNAKKTASKALSIVSTLQSSPAMKAAVGPVSSRIPTVRGATADFESQFNSLKSLLTLENMGIMKGVLSDSDMKVLQQASTALNLGMSQSGFKQELEKVKGVLEGKLGSSANDPLGLGI